MIEKMTTEGDERESLSIETGSYERELRAAVELARRSGAAALSFYGGPLKVEHKGDFDEPVTQADRVVNEMIVSDLRRNFPADGILAEESVDTEHRLTCARVWMIDPLDGTKGFIAGSGDFAVQIGLAVEGRSVLGVVYAPATDTLYRAVNGGGAWVERPEFEPERLRVSETLGLDRMRLAASRSHRSQRMDRVVSALGISEEVQRHSVGIKVGLIVERQCDLYIHLSQGTKQWDTCAPEVIINEAGGRMSDLWGAPLHYNTRDIFNRNGVIATNRTAHASVIARITPLLAEFGRQRF